MDKTEGNKMPVRLAIVGCGAIAEDMHIPTAMITPGVALHALIDMDLARCEGFASRYSVPYAGSDLRELAGKVEVVILATPPHTHLALSRQAFSLGMHVLCEKPLANTVEECEAMCEAAKQAGRLLGVGHMCRFYPVRKRLPEILARHELGRIIHVEASEGKPYSWPVTTGYTFRREMVPGGVLINAGIHTLDTLLDWLGDPVGFHYEDDAAGGLESNVRLHLRFRNGVDARYRQSRTCNLPHHIIVETEHGKVEMATNSVKDYVVVKEGLRLEHSLAWSGGSVRDAWRDQLADFVAAVREEGAPRVSGEEGTRVIRLVETCYRVKRERQLPMTAPQPGLTW